MAVRRKKEPTYDKSAETEDESAEEVEGWIMLGQACRRLECTRQRIARLVEEGKLTVREVGGEPHYSESEIEELLEVGFTASRRDLAFDQTIKVLKDTTAAYAQLTSIVAPNTERIMKALTDENMALREQVQNLYAELRSVNELYGALQREVLQTEIEAEREKLTIENKREMVEFLKEKIGPAIIESMASRNFMNSFTDDQIQTFIDVGGVLTERQAKTLSDILKQRKNAAERAEKAKKANGTPEHAAEHERSGSVGDDKP